MNSNFLKTTLLLLTVILITSCDKIEEATQVTLNEDFTLEIPIIINEANPTYQDVLTLNLADNADLRDYLDKIESVQITSASYSIKNFQGNADATAQATITSASQTFGPFAHQLQSDAQQQRQFALTGATKLQALATTLKNTNRLSFTYNVAQDQASNSSFTVVITVKTKIVAQAL